MNFFRRKEKGFTLIEMMIVIGIMGVLSTVIIQQVNEARRSGVNARIDIYMHQMLQAMQQYYIENDTFPQVYTNGYRCFGNYPDEGDGIGCGGWQEATETWAYAQNDQDFVDALGEVFVNVPQLDRVRIDVAPAYQEIIGEYVRGGIFSCAATSNPFLPDCTHVSIIWYKNHDGKTCNVPGSYIDGDLTPIASDVTSCITWIRDGDFVFY